MTSNNKILAVSLLKACRPSQWTKNFLVFAAPLFSFQFDPAIWINSVIAFITFCLISGAIYLFNDIQDIASDRIHPAKRFRPIASGNLPVPIALFSSISLFLCSIILALVISIKLGLIILMYGLIQIAYCLRLKKEPLLDILCISSGFLLRALAGVLASDLSFSPWFILTVGLLALFLAVEKRKAELRYYKKSEILTRQVLKRYSLPLLLRFENLLASSAFISYSLWAAGPALNGAISQWMLLSTPFVLIGIFRYQLISDPEESERRKSKGKQLTTEKPEEILLGDKGIKLTILGWLITVFIIGVIYRV
tara:strand:+ start:1220 stop:2146 length:927 start_codon:yes stop_codon:yes gene_type:complete